MASYTLADGTVPHVTGALKVMSHLIDTIEKSETASETLLQARLAPDMLPFSLQVYILADTSCKLLARLQGVEPLALGPHDQVKTIADARAILAKAQDFLAAADANTIATRADETVSFGMGRDKPDAVVKAREYAAGYSLPNVFFHTVTAYAILRKEGVTIGKDDYLRHFLGPYLS